MAAPIDSIVSEPQRLCVVESLSMWLGALTCRYIQGPTLLRCRLHSMPQHNPRFRVIKVQEVIRPCHRQVSQITQTGPAVILSADSSVHTCPVRAFWPLAASQPTVAVANMSLSRIRNGVRARSPQLFCAQAGVLWRGMCPCQTDCGLAARGDQSARTFAQTASGWQAWAVPK